MYQVRRPYESMALRKRSVRRLERMLLDELFDVVLVSAVASVDERAVAFVFVRRAVEPDVRPLGELKLVAARVVDQRAVIRVHVLERHPDTAHEPLFFGDEVHRVRMRALLGSDREVESLKRERLA